MMRRCFLGFALSLLALPASAQQPVSLTTNTLRLAPGQASPSATLADMAFLVGHWTGDGLGGVFEEIWTAPKQGVMVGLYRGLKADGSPVFNELLLLREEKGSLMVRLKHFDPDLIGWEEKSQVVTMPFVAKHDGVMHFDGMAFKATGPDTVSVYLAIENKKDGTVREATFNYRRAK
jgi:Domain of unknown function (DUF6265)